MSERFKWAVDVLNVKHNEQLLEIGCGAGLLAENIAAKLVSGKVTAFDRSPSMTKLARKRNAGLPRPAK